MTYPVKIEFKEYPSGSWQDWSEFLSEAPTINRRVESENEGEAGVIVFDNANVSFRYDADTPVYSAFSQNLSEKQRYLFRISAPKSDKSYVQLFEGMTDFSTIKWSRVQEIISFEIVDKLSALGILSAIPARVEGTLVPRILAQTPDAKLLQFIPTSSPFVYYLSPKNVNHAYIDLNGPLVFPGEILSILISRNPAEYKDYVVINSVLFVYESVIVNKVTFSHEVDLSAGGEIIFAAPFNDIPRFYEKELYGININNITSGTLTNLNGQEIIKALYNQAWPGVSITYKPEDMSFPVPAEYAIRMTDENPLGGTPLEALKTLADSMKCYIYNDRTGNLIVQGKSNENQLASGGVPRIIGSTKIYSSEKSYFWDKLIDGVSLTVKSWIRNEDGEYYESRISRTLQVGGSGFIKPKNELTKELLAPLKDPPIVEQMDLDNHAAAEAEFYLDFYGKRHSSYDLVLHLDDNTLLWELVDNLVIDGVQFFFTSINIDLVEKTVSITPVEIQGHQYDFRQVVVGLSEGNSLAVSSGGSGAEGTNIVLQEKGIVYVG